MSKRGANQSRERDDLGRRPHVVGTPAPHLDVLITLLGLAGDSMARRTRRHIKHVQDPGRQLSKC